VLNPTPYRWLAVGLLERDDQLAVLADRFAAAEHAGQLVLVRGEAGTGKSALIQEFVERHVPSEDVLLGRCDDLFAARPLGPFVDIARARVGALAAALPSGDPVAVCEAFLSDLAGAPRPVVVVLEDLQWADEATLDLLRFIARRLDALRCVVIATYRDDLAVDHPLRRAWGSFVGPLVTRISLEPLSVAAVASLAEGTDVDARALHARTGGNPFFVVEVLAGAHAGLPATVRDTILSRAAHLTGRARDCLDAAAILGRHATADTVTAVGDGDDVAIDECIAAGLLVADGPHLGFRHDLTREAIDDSLTPLRRQQLHRRALVVLAASDDVVQRAHHALGADDREAIVELATRAADQCAAVGAQRQAALLYGRAIEHLDAFDPAQRLRVLQAYARACMEVELIADAVRAGDEALAMLTDGDDEVALAEWECWLSTAYWNAARVEEGMVLAKRAVARLESYASSDALARAVGELASQYMVGGWYDDALTTGTRAIELGDARGLDIVAIRGLDVVGTTRIALGDAGGVPLQLEALDRAKRAGLAWDACRVNANIGCMALVRGDTGRALDAYSDGIRMAEQHELVYRRTCLLVTRIDVLLALGLWSDATADAQTVLEQAHLAPHHRGLAVLALGVVRTRRGDPDAAAALDDALAILTTVGESQFVHPTRVARAQAARLAGDDATARAEIEADLALVDWLDLHQQRELAWWAQRTGAAHAATLEAIDGVAHDARGWAEYWEGRSCRYEAADALGDSDDEADLRNALEALLELEARPRAQQVARRLRDLGARRVPRGPRATTRANAAGLTRREVEVAALLRDGLTNPEIADRLVLSPKTVDHHVSAVLSKLGVSNRRHVADAAQQAGIDLAPDEVTTGR
jgi:ATP/maltotriose-dependent transcriptional regulator MalT